MFIIALRNLFGERGRFVITISGVTFSALLILILTGLYQGWSAQMSRLIGDFPADIWIGQKGTGDLSHSVSLLPATLESSLKAKSYVRSVVPFVGRPTKLTIDDEEQTLYLLAVDPDVVLKPYRLLEGAANPNPGEVVIDDSLARAKKLGLGSFITVANTNLKVIGIATGGNRMVYTFAFAHRDDVKRLLGTPAVVNYFLVTLQDPINDRSTLARDFPDLGVMTKQEMLDTNSSMLKASFLPIIGVLELIAVVIGIAVIGLTIFTATIEKSREYGVLKAIGYSSSQLFGVALIQSLTAGIIGFLLAVLLAPLVAGFGGTLSSGFIYKNGWQEMVIIGGLVIVMSTFASLLPLRRLMTIDPAIVFKA